MNRNRRHPSPPSPWLIFLGLVVCLPGTAYAYLDPGSGSLIFQSLLALVFGIGVGVRAIRHYISEGIGKLLGRKRTDDTD
jgi:tetrahydromethanopterin S-methyltransferase subunit C